MLRAVRFFKFFQEKNYKEVIVAPPPEMDEERMKMANVMQAIVLALGLAYYLRSRSCNLPELAEHYLSGLNNIVTRPQYAQYCYQLDLKNVLSESSQRL